MPDWDGNSVASREALGHRISEVIALFETKKSAAEVAGVDPDQLTNYERARSKPPFEVVARLARAQRVGLEWLATGQGPMRLGGAGEQDGPQLPSPLPADEDLMSDLVDGISRIHKEMGGCIDPAELGRLAAREHNIIVASTEDAAERQVGVRMSLERLRRDLTAAATAEAAPRRPT